MTLEHFNLGKAGGGGANAICIASNLSNLMTSLADCEGEVSIYNLTITFEELYFHVLTRDLVSVRPDSFFVVGMMQTAGFPSFMNGHCVGAELGISDCSFLLESPRSVQLNPAQCVQVL